MRHRRGRGPFSSAKFPRCVPKCPHLTAVYRRGVDGDVTREETGNRCCLGRFVDRLSGPGQDIRRRVVADVRSLPAFGLAELVAEPEDHAGRRSTHYLHQSWPSLVEDLERQPPGTHTVVVGYSLGANSHGVRRQQDEIYRSYRCAAAVDAEPESAGHRQGRTNDQNSNPNSWMTFGGMGSKKLVGPNIEYIANNDFASRGTSSIRDSGIW